jgi:hypothetical protein
MGFCQLGGEVVFDKLVILSMAPFFLRLCSTKVISLLGVKRIECTACQQSDKKSIFNYPKDFSCLIGPTVTPPLETSY